MSLKDTTDKISFLVRLLGDRDRFVRDRVREEFLRLGEDALPFLEIAARDENLSTRAHAAEIAGAFRPQKLRGKFRRLSRERPDGGIDLEEGVLLVVEYGYPDADPQEIRNALDRMARELRHRPRFPNDPQNTVEILTNYFFREKGFAGDEQDYFNPENSYFNRVLSRRTGIPITLSALCVLVARRLDWPIVGVGLPGHFVAKYDSPEGPLFFDPFNRGRILTKTDCAEIVARFGFKFEERHLNKTPDREILLRMIHNLILIYNRNGRPDRAGELTAYSNILMNLPETRDHSKLT